MINFHLDQYDQLEKDCEHEFPYDNYEFTSESGMAYCGWQCSKCHGKVWQFLAERILPDKEDIAKLFKEKKK